MLSMCSRNCNRNCSCGKCREFHCEDSGLLAEKNLLSLCFTTDSPCNKRRFTAKYEIVLINQSNKCISDIKIKDSLFGSIAGCCPVIECVDVSVPACDKCNLLVQTQECERKKGILLEPCGSSVPPCSICTLILTIKGFFEDQDSARLDLAYLQNTLIITGVIRKKSSCGCETAQIFPIYVKSGIIKYDPTKEWSH
jgi:hypothetical protein